MSAFGMVLISQSDLDGRLFGMGLLGLVVGVFVGLALAWIARH